MSVDTNTPIVGADLPDTSQAMQRKAFRRSGTLRKEIYDYLGRTGGATDDQMEIGLDRSHQSVSGTRRSLVKDGYVEDSGGRALTRYGNSAIIWVLTDKPVR